MTARHRAACTPALLLIVAACSSQSSGGGGTDSGPPEQDSSSGSDAVQGQDAGPVTDAAPDSTASGADGSGGEAGTGDAPISDSGRAQACTAAGGTVTTATCCQSTGDFADNCLVGACGCSPSSSHAVQSCDCGAGKCWDGTTCVPRG